jgi:hypothetical protein
MAREEALANLAESPYDESSEGKDIEYIVKN